MSNTVRYRHSSETGDWVMVLGPIARSPALSPGAKATDTLLRHYACQETCCFPGQVFLAGEVPCRCRALEDYLQELTAIGLITIERRGLTRTNVYRIEGFTDVETLRARPFDDGLPTSLSHPVTCGLALYCTQRPPA